MKETKGEDFTLSAREEEFSNHPHMGPFLQKLHNFAEKPLKKEIQQSNPEELQQALEKKLKKEAEKERRREECTKLLYDIVNNFFGGKSNYSSHKIIDD